MLPSLLSALKQPTGPYGTPVGKINFQEGYEIEVFIFTMGVDDSKSGQGNKEFIPILIFPIIISSLQFYPKHRKFPSTPVRALRALEEARKSS